MPALTYHYWLCKEGREREGVVMVRVSRLQKLPQLILTPTFRPAARHTDHGTRSDTPHSVYLTAGAA